eukprot:1979249-Rhodomonas_salina.2
MPLVQSMGVHDVFCWQQAGPAKGSLFFWYTPRLLRLQSWLPVDLSVKVEGIRRGLTAWAWQGLPVLSEQIL